MRYIHFYGNAGCCGTDYHDFEVYGDNTDDEEIGSISYDKACDNASSFSYCHTGWEEDFESEEDEEQYYENALSYCGWEELSEEDWRDLKEMYT